MSGGHATHSATQRTHIDRRKLLGDAARTACGVGLLGLGIGGYAHQAKSLPAMAIRPPGARGENEFLAACARCGLCVRACPYDILKLAEPGRDNTATGTPYFMARTGPCRMCEDIPCVPACPTGALDHGLGDILDARMGLAVVVDQESCIAFQGLRCEVCFNACPLRGKALKLEYQPNARSGKPARIVPVVSSDACTGCGLCEHACILEEAAVKVFAIRLARGGTGRPYRSGWQQKRKAGGSPVTPDTRHRYNLPDGVRDDRTGRGLIIKRAPGAADAPVSTNALQTLRRGIKEAR